MVQLLSYCVFTAKTSARNNNYFSPYKTKERAVKYKVLGKKFAEKAGF